MNSNFYKIPDETKKIVSLYKEIIKDAYVRKTSYYIDILPRDSMCRISSDLSFKKTLKYLKKDSDVVFIERPNVYNVGSFYGEIGFTANYGMDRLFLFIYVSHEDFKLLIERYGLVVL